MSVDGDRGQTRLFRLIVEQTPIAIVSLARRWPPVSFEVDGIEYRAMTYSELGDDDVVSFDVYVKPNGPAARRQPLTPSVDLIARCWTS